MNKHGFTLIESLVSILLLSICLSGGLALYFASREVMTLATHKRIAMEMANQQLEEIKEDVLENGFDSLVADDTWHANGAVTFGQFSVQSRQKVTEEDIGPFTNKQVELEVTWNEAGKVGPRTITLTTQFADFSSI